MQLAKAIIAFLLLAIPFSHPHAQGEEDCLEALRSDTDRLLALGFREFDQDMNGGWRAIAAKGCLVQAAEVIELYAERHDGAPTWLLLFHAGQNYALAGETSKALESMGRSLAHDTNHTTRWPDYVIGVMAFLRQDQRVLEAKVKALEASDAPVDTANLQVLRRLSNAFGASYSEALTGR